jgi:hypothetical protein
MCIDWYYGTSATFNPYNGQGTFMGCSQVAVNPPSQCASCPLTLALYVDACGTEADNEIIAVLSGSGFFVDDLELDFDDVADNGAGNFDIGGGCSWMEPTAAAVASIQSICPGATIIGAGPGEAVPANTPVIIFTSSGYDFNYNFGSLCPLSPVIYVMQNGCNRNTDGFPNSGGSISTNLTLPCGCNDNTTYNTGSLVGGNGAFVTDANLPFPIYGNASCGFPSLPGGGGGGGGSQPFVIPPFTYTITPDMCNAGPYWVRGIVNPLPAGCPQTLTNAMPFNVPCANPNLLPGPDMCNTGPIFNLNTLRDPAVLNGTWSGPGVTGSNFNPSGLSGPITLTFTPSGPCGTPGTTTINVNTPPFASIAQVPDLCAGQGATLDVSVFGAPDFTFNLLANGAPAGNFTVSGNSLQIPINPTPPSTTYTITNLKDANCPGPNTSMTVQVSAPGTATLSLVGPASVCAGQAANFSVDFSGGLPPYQFTPLINGVPQVAQASGIEPVTFTLTIPAGNSTVTIIDASANDCSATIVGQVAVTGQAAPLAQLQNTPKTICQGQADTIRVAVSNAGTLTYALNGIAQPPIAVVPPLAIIPVNSGIGTNTYTLTNYTVAGINCAPQLNGQDVTIVQALPTATLSGGVSICAAGNVPLSIAYTPANLAATFNFTAGGVAQTPVTGIGSPIVFSVNASATTTYALTSATVGVCAATLNSSTTVTVGSGPTGVMSGGNNLCINSAGDSITVALSGGGPYTFVYSINGVAQPPITTTDEDYKIFISPNMYTKYELVSVSNPSCAGNASGMAEIFVFATSSANLPGDLSFCGSVSTTVLANVTGTAPFTLTFSINDVVQPTVTVDEGPIAIPANINTTTVYKLINIQSPGCSVPLTDSMTITILKTPTISNLKRICNQAAGTYIVQFDIVDGTAPYTLTGGSGSFSGNLFTSDPIPQANGYAFAFNDVNNCATVTVDGPSTCNCVTSAGTMSGAPVLVCAGQPVSAVFNNDPANDGNDVLAFILHDQPSFPVGQIYAWNSTPNFDYNTAFPNNTMLYISAIMGNAAGNGQVLLSDPCLSVAVGIPVEWRPAPSASLAAGPLDACMGDTVSIEVNLLGTPPFTLLYNYGNVAGNQSVASNAAIIKVLANSSDTFALVGIQNALCNAADTPQVVLQVHTAPTVSGLTTICDLATNTYTVGFNVSATNLSEVSVSGLPGVFNAATGVFASQSIPKADAFQFVVKDIWQCDSVVLSGNAICDCTTDAGNLSSTPLSLCFGANAVATAATGTTLANGDVLRYLLVTTPNPPFSGILSQSATPNLGFPAIVAGTTYYIVAVAGPALGVGIDPNHPCTDYSSAQPVQWRPVPTATLSGPANICKGDMAELTVQLTGGDDYVYTINGLNFSQTIQNDTSQTNNIAILPSANTNYAITAFTANGCVGNSSGVFSVLVRPVPEIVGIEQICAPDRDSFVLRFSVSNGAAPNTTYTITGITGSFQDTVFTSGPLPANSAYGITVSNALGCSSSLAGFGTCDCQTLAGDLSPLVSDACLTGTVNASPAGNQVLEQGYGLYYVLCSDPSTLPTGLIAVNDIPQFGFAPGMVEELPYFIVAVATTVLPNNELNFNDPCIDFSNAIEVVFHAPPQLEILGYDSLVCPGTTYSIPLKLVGNAPFNLTYQLNGVAQPPATSATDMFVIFGTDISVPLTLVVTGISDKFCTGFSNDTAMIALLDQPSVTILGADTICPGGTAVLTLKLVNTASAQVEVLRSNGPSLGFSSVSDGFSFEVDPLVTTTYSLGTVVFSNNECPGLAEGSATVVVNPLLTQTDVANYNGFGVSCAGAADGSIEIIVEGGSNDFTYLWNTNATTSDISNLSAGTYTVTIADASGCSQVETFVIAAPAAIVLDVLGENPACFGETTGSLLLETLSGGAQPITITLNGEPIGSPTAPTFFSNLGAGDYTLEATDANGCTENQTVLLAEPTELLVNLGDDLEVALGDSAFLEAKANADTLRSVVWGLSPYIAYTDSLLAALRPDYAQVYSVTVIDTAGCMATDDILVAVVRNGRLYVPNVFQPGGSDGNGALTVFGGPEVSSIRLFQIFDRWGDKVFEQRELVPNDPTSGWDGRVRNREAAPGVYAYILEVVWADGQSEWISGDITVVR